MTIGALFAPVFAIMIADYYLVKRGAYTADILKPRDGRYWYTAGVNWSAIVAWVVGAAGAYLFTYVWTTPVGATIPAFAITFALYLLLSLRGRTAGPQPENVHLADAVETRSPHA